MPAPSDSHPPPANWQFYVLLFAAIFTCSAGIWTDYTTRTSGPHDDARSFYNLLRPQLDRARASGTAYPVFFDTDQSPDSHAMIPVLFFRATYFLWPTRMVTRDPNDTKPFDGILRDPSIPPPRWLRDHGIQQILAFAPPHMRQIKVIPVTPPPTTSPADQHDDVNVGACACIALYFALILLLGYTLFSAISGRSAHTLGQIFGVSAILGAGSLALILLAVSVLGLAPNRNALATIAAIAVALLALLAWRGRLVRLDRQPLPLSLKPTRWIILPILAIIYCGCLTLSDALATPPLEQDSYAIWQLKAKILFYSALHPTPDYFSSRNLSYSHLRYPLLWPMLCAAAQTAVGAWNEILGKSPAALLYLGMAALIFAAVRRRRGPMPAAFSVALLLSTQVLLNFAGSGNADLPLTAFSAAACIFLLRFLESAKIADAAIMTGMAILCAWTKNEGLPLALTIPLAAAICSLPGRRRRFLAISAAAFACVILAQLPWSLYSHSFPLTDENYPARLTPSHLIASLPTLIHLLPAMARRELNLGIWGLFWFMPPIASLFNSKAAFHRSFIALWLIIISTIATCAIALAITPLNSYDLIETTLDRLMLHIAPAAVLLVGLQMPLPALWNPRPAIATSNPRL